MKKVKLSHGHGGKDTDKLIKEIFYKHFDNSLLINALDASVFETSRGRMAFTTDSFVVKPIIFSGGDIGKLSVCGTINDLIVSGANPRYLSCGFIIEEGFDMEVLDYIAQSMAAVCKETEVKIITGDTKVVERGSADGIFINTAGIGFIQGGYQVKSIHPGDQIIVTGGIGEHGTAMAVDQYNIKVEGNIQSDCRPLKKILDTLENFMGSIKLMKDPTRGGLATALNEMKDFARLGIHIVEEFIPMKKEVVSINQLLGLDHLYMACEGRMILVVDQGKSRTILEKIKEVEGFEDASIIGAFTDSRMSLVYMETPIGGKRILGPLEGDMLPRIC